MRQLMERILSWFHRGTSKLLLLAGAILLVWGTLAPIGTLVWWINRESENPGNGKARTRPLSAGEDAEPNTGAIDCYLIFLTGVGDFSANQLDPGEEEFLDRLVNDHSNCVAVPDVFPYSVANKGLGSERLLSPLWEFAEQGDGWLENVDVLIKIRNLWRFAISIDDRYGRIYNGGTAEAILDRMDAAHPIPNLSSCPLKVVLIGTSGGAQVALGAAHYLNQWLDAELIIISMGGDFSGGEGFDAVNQAYHLRGERDWIEDISGIVFPSRWSWTVGSPFNRAKQQGRYTALVTGPHQHDGDEGYFGQETIEGKNLTYLDLTLQIVNQLPIWSRSENF